VQEYLRCPTAIPWVKFGHSLRYGANITFDGTASMIDIRGILQDDSIRENEKNE
jgi:hypothetical protein